jgi:formate-dependent nitrite reductase membrane component NrfD
LKPDKAAVVPPAEVRSYYDQPVLHEPVWTWEVPTYFFLGGLAGSSSTLALAARLGGQPELARALERTAAVAVLPCPLLLVSDLGRPARALNMLRVFKPRSPVNLGAWVLAGYAPAAVGRAVIGGVVGWLAGTAAAGLGPLLATYTAVLLADTAVPAWHEARRELPFVFVGGALASAGAAGVALVAPSEARPARAAVLAGVAVELAAGRRLEHRLGPLGEPYRSGSAGRLGRATRLLGLAGAALVATAGRRRHKAAIAGAALVAAGAACERFAVIAAGMASARDPAATVGPQRARLDAAAGSTPGHPLPESGGTRPDDGRAAAQP